MNTSQISSTYKSKDTEETLDLMFYRPVGYLIARASMASGLTPNQVTVLGTLIGITGGLMLYPRSLWVNLSGILLLILSEAMDSADGQLARMTGIKSKIGRILDGTATGFIFLAVYMSLIFKTITAGGSPICAVLACMAGYSHSLQSLLADYYRSAYLKYAFSADRSELESSEEIKKRYQTLSLRKDFLDKVFLKFYYNYTVRQESFTGSFRKMAALVHKKYGEALPEKFSAEYSKLFKKQIKYYNILTTNTREFFLFFSVLALHYFPLYQGPLFFAFEVILLNALLLYMTSKQNYLGRRLVIFLQEEVNC